MQSGTERFSDKQYGNTPFGVYDTDSGSKKTLATSVKDSKILLASSFSNSNRWSSALKSAAPDMMYDTNVGRFQTLSSSVEASPINYSNLRSKYRRLGPLTTPTEAPDVEYNTDAMHKASMVNALAQSSIRYSVMRSPTKRFKEKVLTSTPKELGPGSYDPQPMLDLRKSQEWRALSSFRSTSSRFGEKHDPSKWLGGTWSPEKDTRRWGEKGTQFSKAEIRRPQYLPP